MESLIGEAEALFRDLHRHPELSWHERETKRRLVGFLSAHGVTSVDGPLETSVLVDIEGTHPGPRLFVRADIDALPVREQSDVEWASSNEGCMHACGHDFHSATAACAAVVLGQRRDRLDGSVRIAFQPAEEALPSGSEAMVANGAADGFDHFLAFHAEPSLPVGRVGFREGAMNAAVDAFSISIHGRGGHSARPQLAINPVSIGAVIVPEVEGLVAKNVDGREPAVLAVTAFRGGSASNVIASEASLEGTLRTTREETRERLQDRMEHVVHAICEAHGARAEVVWTRGAPSVLNDPGLVAVAKTVVEEQLGGEAFHLMASPTLGGDDFAQYGRKGSLLLVRIGTTASGESSYDLHHPRFRVDPSVFSVSVPLMVGLCERLLGGGR